MTLPFIKGAQPVFRLSLMLSAVAVVVTSCGPAEDDSFEPPAPKVVAFEGSLDPAYVGDWSTANKNSSMTLKDDGKASMENIAVGRGKSKVDGEWKLSDGKLLFKVKDQVMKYDAKLEGDKLRVQNKASKLDVVYLRAKK